MMTMRDTKPQSRHEHRDPQMDVFFEKTAISDDTFESKRDILSLEEVMEALDKVRGLPPMKAAAELFSKLGVERLQAMVRRAL
ncbi:MAG TPA: hypothetical protein PK095_20960, partial [Myxococcota bacterium]|nr:hypothetical protein [Myxococcota bacterium]